MTETETVSSSATPKKFSKKERKKELEAQKLRLQESQMKNDESIMQAGASASGGTSAHEPSEPSEVAQIEADGDAPSSFGEMIPDDTPGPSLQEIAGVPDPPVEPEKEQEEEKYIYYVSSRNLVAASPWFRRALTKGKWTESEREGKDGLIYVEAYDWDCDAFLTLLNIFHLEN